MSAETLSHQMGGLAIGVKPLGSSNAGNLQSSNGGSSGPRDPPAVLKKYMNPALLQQRAQQAGGSGSHSDGSRAGMMKLAGLSSSTLPSQPNYAASPSKIGKLPTKHAAHGVHGPAHATASRVLTGQIMPAKKVASTTNTMGVPMTKDVQFGKYDGGLKMDGEDPVDSTGRMNEHNPARRSGNGAEGSSSGKK